jgi:RHS repeat-associated protein
VAQEISGSVTIWAQDQASPLAQVLLAITDGQTTAYLLGLGRLAQVEDGDWEWFLGDALGSVRQLVDDNGTVVLARDYTPFGLVLSESGLGSSGYGYTGEQQAVPELIYLRARLYSPSLGRFLSVDPFPGYAGLPQTLNVYVYCLNNVINCTDPSGELPPWLEELVVDFLISSLD